MFAQELRGSRSQADSVDAPVLTRAVFGRQAESAVHEEAAGNKEGGEMWFMGDSSLYGITTTGASLAAN